MDKTSVERELSELREQIRYHGRKYYTEDDPEISDFDYDKLYRRLEELLDAHITFNDMNLFQSSNTAALRSWRPSIRNW